MIFLQIFICLAALYVFDAPQNPLRRQFLFSRHILPTGDPVGKKCAEKGGTVCAADSGVHQKHIQRGEADEDL